jgi:hypothetical protein
MNIARKIEILEQVAAGRSSQKVTVFFKNGDIAKMPLAEIIPMLHEDHGISSLKDDSPGNGYLVELVNDLLSHEDE